MNIGSKNLWLLEVEEQFLIPMKIDCNALFELIVENHNNVVEINGCRPMDFTKLPRIG
jgi:hypothetical protein